MMHEDDVKRWPVRDLTIGEIRAIAAVYNNPSLMLAYDYDALKNKLAGALCQIAGLGDGATLQDAKNIAHRTLGSAQQRCSEVGK